ncbi:MAG: HIT domain-containing protein [Spirochaetes bacterium]|nr:HIT domain-containing protein [Spirochaetota bacterium]
MKHFREYLFNTDKIKYIKSEQRLQGCILCAIRDRNPGVKSLEIRRTGGFIISLNLYPFNPGHLLIFPVRHVEDYSLLTDSEALEMHHLSSKAVNILKKEFNPSGFNIGCNLGSGSGASIPHIHQHIVPRYDNEIGFIDVLSGSRIYVEDPIDVLNRLKKEFSTI